MITPTRWNLKISLVSGLIGGLLVIGVASFEVYRDANEWVSENCAKILILEFFSNERGLRGYCSDTLLKPGGKRKVSFKELFLGIMSPEEKKEYCKNEFSKNSRCLGKLKERLNISSEEDVGDQNLETFFSISECHLEPRNYFRLSECNFQPRTLFGYFREKSNLRIYFLPVVAGLFSLGTLSLILCWIIQYPHIGWRRASISVGLLATGVVSGMRFLQTSNPFSIISRALFFGLASSLILLVGRQLYLWVLAGFKKENLVG